MRNLYAFEKYRFYLIKLKLFGLLDEIGDVAVTKINNESMKPKFCKELKNSALIKDYIAFVAEADT